MAQTQAHSPVQMCAAAKPESPSAAFATGKGDFPFKLNPPFSPSTNEAFSILTDGIILMFFEWNG